LKAHKKKRGMEIRKSRKRRISHKVRIKRAVKTAAKAFWKHIIELPEKERDQNLAAIQRIVKRKLNWKKTEKRK